MDCIVHGVAKSQTWLSDFHFYLTVSLRFCIFSLFWLNLSLAKFSHRQKAGRGHGGVGRTIRSFSFSIGWWQPLEFINRKGVSLDLMVWSDCGVSVFQSFSCCSFSVSSVPSPSIVCSCEHDVTIWYLLCPRAPPALAHSSCPVFLSVGETPSFTALIF